MSQIRENTQMRILSAIGIILVVAGHLGYNVFEIGDLFPYYSFHIFIFLFISGYFYRPEWEDRVLAYIGRKCITLLLPYLLWNLFYGLLAALLHRAGFTIGREISLRTLFLSPFLDGHQFMYHFPAWFVPVLFIIEVINICMRRVLYFFRLNREWLILAGCLAAGMVTVWLAIGGHVWGYWKLPGRILFMLPGFQLGRIYKEKLEHRDTWPESIYFPAVMGIQVLITIWCGGLAFSAVWCSSFANGPVIPYITVITGIAFWLRVARLVEYVPWIAAKMVYIGRNTFSVMMHHMTAFMLVKGIFYLISVYTPLCSEFSRELFFSEISFVFLPGGSEAAKWLYLAAGVALPLLAAGLTGRLWQRVIAAANYR